MKTLVIVAHPDLAQSTVNRRWIAELQKHPDRFTVHDLYAHYRNGKIDVAAEQARVDAHGQLVLQFPVYWFNCPPLLKQWLDDVLTYGWAYGPAGTALHGKELALAVSSGGSAENYTHSGSVHYGPHELLRPFQATSGLIGTRFITPFITAGTMGLADEELAERAQAYTAWLATPDHPELGVFE